MAEANTNTPVSEVIRIEGNTITVKVGEYVFVPQNTRP